MRELLKIHKKEISFKRPYIVAEIGSNWDTLDDCKKSIQAAAQCFADAVKFQYYTSKDLYGTNKTVSHELPFEWIPDLSSHAHSYNLGFILSTFNHEKVLQVDEFVDAHKVASCENNYLELMFAMRKTSKPVIVSTGGITSFDVLEKCLKRSELLNYRKLILLYCECAYPSRYYDLKLITKLRQKFETHVGYSDHTVDVIGAPVMAAQVFKADIIEKHFMYKGMSTPDSEHSLLPHEFEIMVDAIRKPIKLYLPTPDELHTIETCKRREFSYGVYRP